MNMKKFFAGLLASLFFVTAVSADVTTPNLWKKDGNKIKAVQSAATQVCDSAGTSCLPFAGGGGGAPTDATYITQTANGSLSAEQALSALATGIVKNTTTTGVLSIAQAGIDYIVSVTHAIITAFTVDASPTSDDIVWTVNDPLGTPADRKVTAANLITKAHGLSDGIVKVASGVMAQATADTDYLTPGTAASTYAPIATPTFTTNITSPIIYGSSASGGDLSLYSTTHATKGTLSLADKVYVDETSGWMAVGANSTSATINGSGVTGQFGVWVEDGGTNKPGIGIGKADDTSAASGATVFGGRSRGTLSSPTVIQSGDLLMGLIAIGNDGTDYATSSRIDFEVDGTPGANDMPGRIVFKVAPDGSQTVAEALRISQDKTMTFSGTAALGANNLTMTGSLAATGARVTKGWFTDIESTNMPTVGGTSLSSTFSPIAGSSSIVTTGTITSGVWNAGAVTSTGVITSGAVAGTTGALLMNGTTSGTVTLSTADAAGTWTMKLPTTGGTSGYFLQTDGAGNTTWAAASGGISWGTSISSGSGTGLAMTTADLSGANPFITMGHTASGTLTSNTTTQFSQTSSRTATGGTPSDNFINALFSRTNVTNGANLTSAGSVVNIVGTDTQTANTLTPTYDLLKLDPSLRSTGSSIRLTVANSTVAPTNGHIYSVLGNTQSVAHIMQKIDTGTSAQGHTGLYVLANNASTSLKAISVDLSGAGTGYGVHIASSLTTLSRSMLTLAKSGAQTGSLDLADLSYASNSSPASGTLITSAKFQNGTSSNSFKGYLGAVWEATNTAFVDTSTINQAHLAIQMPDISGLTNSAKLAGLFISTNGSGNSLEGVGYHIYQTSIVNNSLNTNGRTTPLNFFGVSRTNTATTSSATDNFNFSYFKRTNVQNGAGGTLNAQGSVLKLENVATQTAGTLTDTVDVFQAVQDVDSTGNIINAVLGATTQFAIKNNGHIFSGGADPVLSACGTTPTVIGSDSAGKITIGTGATTSCTVTFASAFVTNAPSCVITGDNTAVTYAATSTTTVLTITSSADMASDVINYHCTAL